MNQNNDKKMATTKSIERFRNDPKGYKVGDYVKFEYKDDANMRGEIIDMKEHIKTGGRGSMDGDQLAFIKCDNGTIYPVFKNEIKGRLRRIQQ